MLLRGGRGFQPTPQHPGPNPAPELRASHTGSGHVRKRLFRTLIAGLLLPVTVFTVERPVWGLDPRKLITQFIHTAWTAKDGIPGPVEAIAQTPDGYLWTGTHAGLYRFDGISFTAWHPKAGERLISDSICALYVAHDGSLWIGYYSGGIGVLRDGHLRNYPPGNSFPNGPIVSIAEDHDGRIWAAGTYGSCGWKADAGFGLEERWAIQPLRHRHFLSIRRGICGLRLTVLISTSVAITC